MQPFLRGESGALLLVPCSLGPLETFPWDEIAEGELLQRGGLNEGTELPGMLHISQGNKAAPSPSAEGGEKQITLGCAQSPARLGTPGQFSTFTFHYCLSYFQLNSQVFPSRFFAAIHHFSRARGKDGFTRCCHGNTCWGRAGDG